MTSKVVSDAGQKWIRGEIKSDEYFRTVARSTMASDSKAVRLKVRNVASHGGGAASSNSAVRYRKARSK